MVALLLSRIPGPRGPACPLLICTKFKVCTSQVRLDLHGCHIFPVNNALHKDLGTAKELYTLFSKTLNKTIACSH